MMMMIMIMIIIMIIIITITINRVDDITPVSRRLLWPPVYRRVQFQMHVCVFLQTLSGQAPLKYSADDVHVVPLQMT